MAGPEIKLLVDDEGLVFHDMPDGSLYSVRARCPQCRRFTQVRSRVEAADGRLPYQLTRSELHAYHRPRCSVCDQRLPFETLDDLDRSQRPLASK